MKKTVDAAGAKVIQNVNDACKKEDRRVRRLGEELFPLSQNKEEEFTTAELVREAKMYASKLGLSDEDADTVLSNIGATLDEQQRKTQQKKVDRDNYAKSEHVREAKRYATKLGLKEEGAEKVFSKIFDSLSNADAPFNEKLEEQINEDLSDPSKAEFIENLINENVEENEDKYSKILALHVIVGAMDRKTGKLDGKNFFSFTC